MTENCGCGLTLEFPMSNGLVIKNGLPAGGTEGQVLAKSSDEDYDAEWVDGAGGAGIFWATYGTTTNEEIDAAFQAGKLCVCVYNDKIYTLVSLKTVASRRVAYFSCVFNGYMFYVECMAGTWSNTHSEEQLL